MKTGVLLMGDMDVQVTLVLITGVVKERDCSL